VKILHVYKDYYPVLGGIENIIKLLAESQAAAGHEVTALVASLDHRSRTERLNGVTIHKVARLGTVASTPVTPGLPLAFRNFRPDVTHLHSPYPPGEILYALLGGSRVSTVTYHSDIIRQKALLKFYSPLLRLTLGQVDLIMPTSPNYIDSSPFLRPHRDKCRVVPLGVDCQRFAGPKLPLAKRLKERFGRPILLFVGRLRYYKGLETFIEAVAQVPNAAALIAGDGPLRAALESKARALRLDDRVHFAGEVSDEALPAYFQAADCFVLPSNARAEAFGLVLLEAMAAGLPLISTELGTGTSFVNLHEQTGFVVPPDDPPALAMAINALLNDAALRRQFGQAAQTRVRTEFSSEVMVRRVMDVYEELTA
jgi:glycosyltransferase involved in cell wall biosynthesis